MIDFIDLRELQAQQSAELLCAFGQLLLANASYDSTIMGHHGHPLLDHSALKPFVPHVACPACQQAGDVAFHHGTTLATGTGEVHLIGGAFAV